LSIPSDEKTYKTRRFFWRTRTFRHGRPITNPWQTPSLFSITSASTPSRSPAKPCVSATHLRAGFRVATPRYSLTLLVLLDRLCAMLTRLAHMGERPAGSAQIGQRERSR
jgi:hypothetical protein